MTSDQNEAQVKTGGFLGREHHKVRFTDLGETFFARMILLKCADAASNEPMTVELSLCDLFRRQKAEELAASLESHTFKSSPRITELGADMLSALTGAELEPGGKTAALLDFYQDHIASRLNVMKRGDRIDDRLPTIEEYTTRKEGKLTIFEIQIRPATLRERLGKQIPGGLELTAKLMKMILTMEGRPADPGPRIDYRKQVELLTEFLDQRHKVTGETEFALLSNQIPFRWAIEEYFEAGGFTMPSIGTSGVEDKVLLPLFLEVNGYLDIVALDIESDPLQPHDVVVRYSLCRPAQRNIFAASHQGLEPAIRSLMSETELRLYDRLHREARELLVFGGRPKFEASFGAACAWMIRKAAFCLQEPSYLARPGREWLEQHKNDKKIQMEDEFFLPKIYEGMRDNFSSRVVKKPERFAGEIDILFDDDIPIELKVRKGQREPIDIADIDEKYKPGGQAAAYAAVSRLGFVFVLDLPAPGAPVVNLENCAKVVERRFPESAEYPTCIVVIVLRCYEQTPSSSH
jgi:hypothetical protein